MTRLARRRSQRPLDRREARCDERGLVRVPLLVERQTGLVSFALGRVDCGARVDLGDRVGLGRRGCGGALTGERVGVAAEVEPLLVRLRGSGGWVLVDLGQLVGRLRHLDLSLAAVEPATLARLARRGIL